MAIKNILARGFGFDAAGDTTTRYIATHGFGSYAVVTLGGTVVTLHVLLGYPNEVRLALAYLNQVSLALGYENQIHLFMGYDG
jgi:hypothetical protein